MSKSGGAVPPSLSKVGGQLPPLPPFSYTTVQYSIVELPLQYVKGVVCTSASCCKTCAIRLCVFASCLCVSFFLLTDCICENSEIPVL